MTDAVRWRVKRQPSGTVDTDLFDLRPLVDSINRFARSATLLFEDPDGTKESDYPRGQRVELEYSTDGGSTWTRRWAGFRQNKTDEEQSGRFRAECFSYDFFLRRQRVNKSYSSSSISTIIEDLIKNFTAVDYVAGNITVTNDKTLTVSFEGERVDQALDYLASVSADERYGVNDDFEFFFEQQDTSRSPSDITDTEWLDYSLDEKGEKSLNRVRVYYGSGGSESFVLVEDREAQSDLKDKLGAASNPVIAEEFTYPNIDNEDAAREKAQEILTENSTILSGSVTTFDRLEMEPNDIFSLTISEKGVDAVDFAVAEVKYRWKRDETEVTLTENKGDVADRLVDLAGNVRRVSMRDADTDAAGTRFLQFISGVELTLTATVTQKTRASGGFVLGQSQLGQGTGDTLGAGVASQSSQSIESKKATIQILNLLRDLWQDGNAAFTDLSHLAVGTGDETATRADNSLDAEVDREAVEKFGGTGTTTVAEVSASVPAGGVYGESSALQEFSVADADTAGNHYARVTFADVSIDADTRMKVNLEISIDVDTDQQGVITTTGQERLVDLLIGESNHEPTDMVYGTGTTAATESDTSLGNQVHEDAIDSFADRSPGVTDVVERIGTGEVNGNDLSELGEENSANELLSRVVFEALSKTSDFELESNHRFKASNAE